MTNLSWRIKIYIPSRVKKYFSMNKDARKKTSISVDQYLWRKWLKFVVDKTGSSRMISIEVENAIKEYMQNHKMSESGAVRR